ncbi:transglutaminase family protein [Burkholderia orbicola]|uniref:transglutaminase family protein n=1 Tax=Burkholderia orbicola TaxID=2978683 RepID=UPI001902DDDE|nr:transglutaminase family protein [Burkholderia orbicola]MBK1819501.1 transglutaminase family protein [Burkholderia orbicola]
MVTTKGAPKTPAGAGSARQAPASAPVPAPAQAQSQGQAATNAPAAVAPGRLLRVTHDTEYRYAARVESAQHQARLQPLATPRQQVLSFSLDIEPAPESVCTELDAFGNARASFALNLPHDTLLVRSRSTVRVTPPAWSLGARGEPPPAIANPDAAQATAWEAVRDRLRFRAGQPYDPASEFLFASPHVACDPELAAYAAASFTPQRPLVQAAWDLMRRVHADFAYTPNSTDITTSALDALRLRKGVCQDFAHVMIGALRSLGLAARYVSGYLLTQPPPGQPRLIGADASHAWVEVYDPAWPEDGGWLQLDPTNDRAPGDDYVMLSIGRDYADVTPLRGVIRGGGADQELKVGVTVEPLDAD